jgi:ribonuclease BN (tRNA processing enzyme)
MQAPARIWRDDSPDGPSPEASVKVVIIKDGADLQAQGVRVRAAQNSHFVLPQGGFSDNGSQSLALRFDYKNYAIGYTGDTGPSAAVTTLEKGVNLLVSEVIDLPGMIEVVNEIKMMSPDKKASLIEHLKTHHLTPQDAGRMATADGVDRMVFTHLSVPKTTAEDAASLIHQAHETFKGEVLVARELDHF